jgi:hypothetical protein
MRRLKGVWRDAATVYARSAWHVPEYRYWNIEDQTRIQIAEIAFKAYLNKVSFAYTQAVNHPRSQKAQAQVRMLAKELASIGFYILEHNPKADTLAA